jgi:hypothetical protein
MRVMTRAINGHTLFRARAANRRISQRELARGVARRLGVPSRYRALQMAISRIEHKDEAVIAAEIVDALEAELELELGDLSHPYRWAYRLTCLAGAEDRLAWLGGCLPVFSDAKNAYEARGWVTFGEGRVIRELELAHPHEVFNGELERVLGGDWTCVVLDPPYPLFMKLAGTLGS